MISGTPPESTATTGSPDRSASAATTPNVSDGLEWTNSVARAIASATAWRSTGGSKTTRSAMPSSATRACQPGSSAGGASPIIRNRSDGCVAAIRAIAWSRTPVPFVRRRAPT